MTQMTRRNLFATAAAAGAATALTPLLSRNAFAAGAPIKSSGYYTYKLGDYEIVQLMDGARTFPMPDGFVVNASKEKAIAAAELAPGVGESCKGFRRTSKPPIGAASDGRSKKPPPSASP